MGLASLSDSSNSCSYGTEFIVTSLNVVNSSSPIFSDYWFLLWNVNLLPIEISVKPYLPHAIKL
jgi:hypothetical protein